MELTWLSPTPASPSSVFLRHILDNLVYSIVQEAVITTSDDLIAIERGGRAPRPRIDKSIPEWLQKAPPRAMLAQFERQGE
jgi:hypothetical protein